MSIHHRGVKPALTSDSEALTKAPPAPAYLSSQAKAEWKRIMPQLIARQIITRADLAGIENYCSAAGAARQIAEIINAMPVPDLKLGGLQIRYMQTARQLAAEYGLTPTSRARIGSNATGDDDDDNPLAIT
ncbi:phage terminase small subunit P27 family [Cereibacter changlensis JA139]|uniref:Phage terminase small subunit P27 family n=2 Tax=Cereibacter changlensis TaxID=402884 RepID=A0A2T4JPM7_9RHOB|nr:phage terminase small subunit P27 family [Cereibacter changlensis]PTE19875.1 phage terminase small subunit P27 family [Cereibacter changlensis JA139]PZX46444.1 P27 family predicted phage terminase small subunit [Cereibacter changlensis]